MNLCTTSRVTGLDGKEHFAVVALAQQGWPLALCGPTDGAMAKESEAYAKLFADAPVMLDMLEVLKTEFSAINPAFPLSAGKLAELTNLVERATNLVNKHQKPSGKQK